MSPAPTSLIRRYTALAGITSAVVAIAAVPELSGPRGPGREWQIAYAVAAALLIIGAQFWMGRPLRRLPPTPTADPILRRLAQDFPVDLLRGGFVGTLLLGVGTTAWLILRGRPPGASIATGAIAYVVALLPLLALYLGARRLLRSHAAGPPGSGPVGGNRQTLARRMATGVQVPVVIGAVGLLLVQLGNGETYGTDASAYFAERLRTMGQRASNAIEGERARAEFAAALPASVTTRMQPEMRAEFDFGPMPFALLGGVLLLTAVVGRRLARTVTADLVGIGDALRHLTEDDPRPPRPPAVALRETTAVGAALDVTLAGLAAQQSALRTATADRRRSDAAKARFLAHLSHELKSPLNSILGFSELLLAEMDGPVDARQKAHLGTLWRSGDALLRFILALLDLSRFDGLRTSTGARSSGFRPTPTTASDLARVLRRQLRPDPSGAVEITVALHPATTDEAPRAKVDPAHTARALYIAAGRLLDAMDEGEVEIALHHPLTGGMHVVIEVVAAESDDADRQAVVDAWRTVFERGEDRRAGSPGGAAIEVLHRLCDTQGGEVHFENFEPWPRVRVVLPEG